MSLNIIDLITAHGITPKLVSRGKGGEYHSACPKCGGTDRMHAWPQQNNGAGSFWCRQCDVAGDCIKFLMHYDGLSFHQAAERVGKQLGKLPPPRLAGLNKKAEPAPMEPRQCDPPAILWQQRAINLMMKAGQELQNNPDQLQYLASRGIAADQAARWGLGFINSDDRGCIFSSRNKWGLEPKHNNKKPDALWIPRGLVIPNIIDDRVDSLRIRRSSADRNLTMPDLSYHVFPGSGTAPTLKHCGQLVIVVVEAQLDAILIDQVAGDLVGVVALGNSSARPDQQTHEVLQAVNLILIALDSDKAGEQSCKKWLQWYDNAIACPVPTGKDPGEAYQHGVDLREWIKHNMPSIWVA